ncbi:hypothetical protein NGB58_04220 [Escherichia coli]|nr:hypothetical protein [Escherichia coli]
MRKRYFGVKFRNMAAAFLEDEPTWDSRTGVATAHVTLRHSEIIDSNYSEYVAVSWECSEREARDPTLQRGVIACLRDGDFGPFPPIHDALVESGGMSPGLANFHHAIAMALENYTRKHFPQGLDTPAVRGYRRKPRKPRKPVQQTGEAQIILRHCSFCRTSEDVVITLKPVESYICEREDVCVVAKPPRVVPHTGRVLVPVRFRYKVRDYVTGQEHHYICRGVGYVLASGSLVPVVNSLRPGDVFAVDGVEVQMAWGDTAKQQHTAHMVHALEVVCSNGERHSVTDEQAEAIKGWHSAQTCTDPDNDPFVIFRREIMRDVYGRE